jgi:hypothetical protein
MEIPELFNFLGKEIGKLDERVTDISDKLVDGALYDDKGRIRDSQSYPSEKIYQLNKDIVIKNETYSILLKTIGYNCVIFGIKANSYNGIEKNYQKIVNYFSKEFGKSRNDSLISDYKFVSWQTSDKNILVNWSKDGKGYDCSIDIFDAHSFTDENAFKPKLNFFWNPNLNTDDENVRYSWLRAVEWDGFPGFIAQVITPFFLLFINPLFYLISIIIANIIWSFINKYIVNMIVSELAVYIVRLRWFINILFALFFIFTGHYFAAVLTIVLSISWVAGIIGSIGIPTPIGTMQKIFLKKMNRLDLIN